MRLSLTKSTISICAALILTFFAHSPSIYYVSKPAGEVCSNSVTANVSITESTSFNATWKPPPDWKLSHLRQKDVEQFTVRMNAWKRPEQLLVSVKHFLTCPNVAQVQLIWCDTSSEPPEELINNSRVIVERHELNSLNERFRIYALPPTLGILSVDDDVMLPCVALDSGFFRWTQAPHRMVGFDARSHCEVEDGSWKYDYFKYDYFIRSFIRILSLLHSPRPQLPRSVAFWNKYSLTLTRISFIHRDYLDLYISELPDEILQRIATTFNCEDIAMTLMVSSLTEGRAPLLANCWAVSRMVEFYTPVRISGTKTHQGLRDSCVNDFAETFGLKDKLQYAEFWHDNGTTWHDCGAHIGKVDSRLLSSVISSARQKEFDSMINKWNGLSQFRRNKEIDQLYETVELKAKKVKFFDRNTKAARMRYYNDTSLKK